MYHPIPSLSSTTQVYQVFVFVSVILLDSSHLVYLELESRAAAARVAHTSRASCHADPLHLLRMVDVVSYQRSHIASAVGALAVGR